LARHTRKYIIHGPKVKKRTKKLQNIPWTIAKQEEAQSKLAQLDQPTSENKARPSRGPIG
jgi:hypothetical protein